MTETNYNHMSKDGEYLRRGDIVWVDFKDRVAYGYEYCKSRPAVVVSNNLMNRHSDVVQVCYMTSKTKKMTKTTIPYEHKGRQAVIMCDQPTSVSVQCMTEVQGSVDRDTLTAIGEALKWQLWLGDSKDSTVTEPVDTLKKTTETSLLLKNKEIEIKLLKTEIEELKASVTAAETARDDLKDVLTDVGLQIGMAQRAIERTV